MFGWAVCSCPNVVPVIVVIVGTTYRYRYEYVRHAMNKKPMPSFVHACVLYDGRGIVATGAATANEHLPLEHGPARTVAVDDRNTHNTNKTLRIVRGFFCLLFFSVFSCCCYICSSQCHCTYNVYDIKVKLYRSLRTSEIVYRGPVLVPGEYRYRRIRQRGRLQK